MTKRVDGAFAPISRSSPDLVLMESAGAGERYSISATTKRRFLYEQVPGPALRL